MKESNKIAIFGSGESGMGSAMLAAAKGYEVLLSDHAPIPNEKKALLKGAAVSFEENGHKNVFDFRPDLIIKSPGIPEKVPAIQYFIKREIPVISEIEFGFYFSKSKHVAITGTNGKSTTTLLTHHLFQAAFQEVGLAGNIGDSFAKQLLTHQPDWWVLEVSSFQLDGCYDFRPDICLLLNITPDHLDRYEYSFERYVESKFRLVRNIRSTDTFIYHHDHAAVSSGLQRRNLGCQLLGFALQQGDGVVAWVEDHELVFSAPFAFRYPLEDLPIQGPHNYLNAMAAILAALAAGISTDIIAKALPSFQNISHRLEKVAEVDGVLYVNDSKATNVDSANYALQSFDRPIIWIVGGIDKGNDYSSVMPHLKMVKAIVALGNNNEKIREIFQPLFSTTYTEASSMEMAIEQAKRFSEEGDVVLLSPACASFDLFKNYEDRGNQFKDFVVNRRNP